MHQTLANILHMYEPAVEGKIIYFAFGESDTKAVYWVSLFYEMHFIWLIMNN